MNKCDKIQAVKASLMDIFIMEFKAELIKPIMSINYYANNEVMKFFNRSYGAETAEEYEQAVDEFIKWMSFILPMVSFVKRKILMHNYRNFLEKTQLDDNIESRTQFLIHN